MKPVELVAQSSINKKTKRDKGESCGTVIKNFKVRDLTLISLIIAILNKILKLCKLEFPLENDKENSICLIANIKCDNILHGLHHSART